MNLLLVSLFSDSKVALRVVSPLSLILGDLSYRSWMITGDKSVRR